MIPAGVHSHSMGTTHQYSRRVLALDDTELEEFVRQWVLKKGQYTEVERFTGTGDMGRDVVGFFGPQRHEGSWDNYQCKQFGRNLPTDKAIQELGKILYYADLKEFTPPLRYYFVAPRGINRNLRKLIFNPSLLRKTLLDEWDKYCAHSIVENSTTPMSDSLRALIESWDFASVVPVSVDVILQDAAAVPVLYKWFGADPGQYVPGSVPVDVQDAELPYVRALLDAYGEREGTTFPTHADAFAHGDHGEHLKMQRERFFDAESFTRFYRDNTSVEDTDHVRNEVRHGVFETRSAKYPDTLDRVDAVMKHAGTLQPTGPLAKYARVQVKQGICHHFVNEGEWTWRKK
ncbi:MAG: hypothetical protein E5Y89_03105 [Mesorhizobium sp.]|nr:MAG: hypothetical protein E5Y89_03105 [Mesorhizobium sp.]